MEAQDAPAATGARRRARWPRFAVALAVWGGVLYLADRGPLWPGVIALVLGQAVQLWAAGMLPLKKNHGVATGGPYAWVRNPMYVGRFLVGLGLALFTWRWWIVGAYLVAFVVYAHHRVLREEQRLRSLFGEEYEAYCRRVRRWLPRWPERGRSATAWSPAGARKYGQLLVGAALAPVLASLIIRRMYL